MSPEKKQKILPILIYGLVTLIGLIFTATIGYSLYMGTKINSVYSSMINSSQEVKISTTTAHLLYKGLLESADKRSLLSALENIESAKTHTRNLLEDKEKELLINLKLDDQVTIDEIDHLYFTLLEMSKIIESDIKSLNNDSVEIRSKNNWDALYSETNKYADEIKVRLSNLMERDSNIFKITQIILIVLSLILSFWVAYMFYKFQRASLRNESKITNLKEELNDELRSYKKVNIELVESERKLTTLMNNIPGMVYRCRDDDNRTMEYLSDGCSRITGYSPDELIGNVEVSYGEIIHPKDRVTILRQIQEAIETRQPFEFVYRIKTSPGFEKWVWERGVAIHSRSDDVVAVEGFITDITEQKSAESSIQLQSTALEAAANTIVITDTNGDIQWANSAFNKLTGYEIKEALGKNMRILKSGEHDEAFYAYMWRTIKNGKTWHGEIINKRKNGKKYFEEMNITPVIDAQQNITHFVAVMQDITERKKAEKSLRESEERFRNLYENATIGIYRTSPEGKILLANPALIKMLGYDSFESLKKFHADQVYDSPENREIFRHKVETEGQIYGYESTWKRKDGSFIFMRESSRAVRDQNGKTIYYEGTIEDITEKKKADLAIVEAKEKAEKSDQLKSDFLAQISHEIRTPMNVILNFSGLIKEELYGKIDEELNHGLEAIDIEGKRILRTVGMIVDMSELQSDTYEYVEKEIDIFNEIIKPIYDDFKSTADSKKIGFKLINETDNTKILGDDYSIKQIFKNLIDNAIKYTEEGKVDIKIFNRNSNLTISIEDTGIGISEEFKELLYTPFSKEETGYTRTFEGNGLGLALVKKYCDLNDAKIELESEKGKGSKFTVEFNSSS